jgi:hypothetical protein
MLPRQAHIAHLHFFGTALMGHAQTSPPPPAQSNDAVAQEYIRQQERERALRQQQERVPDLPENHRTT